MDKFGFDAPDCNFNIYAAMTAQPDVSLALNYFNSGVAIQTPRDEAITGLHNAKRFTQRAIKSGALDDHSIELIDQAEAIMQMVLDNLKKQDLPPEFSYHMANAVNELQACTKLCSGKLQESVFDLSAAVEKLRGETE